MKVLILYDDNFTYIGTLREYLEAFKCFSKHIVFYGIGISQKTPASMFRLDFSFYDVVFIHYSVRLCYTWHIATEVVKALKHFKGLKMQAIQDEYDGTETARQWIENLGIKVVFTCVPEKYIDNVYPAKRFPDVKFINVLTGYVPMAYEDSEFAGAAKRPSERKYLIGYRGRELPFHLGNLCREKLTIAQEMRRICEERSLPVNIEYNNSERLYGSAWYDFMHDCRAVLGTESGSNVFDEHGEVKNQVEMVLAQFPETSYDEIHQKYIAPYEGKLAVMNQISPRIFEAIALKTALVLFEGEYSGVVKPDIHFIPLKKDFSNVDNVIRKLNDEKYLEEITERAYNDVIASGKYSYRNFIGIVDSAIEKYALPNKQLPRRFSLSFHKFMDTELPLGQETKAKYLQSLNEKLETHFLPRFLLFASMIIFSTTQLFYGLRLFFSCRSFEDVRTGFLKLTYFFNANSKTAFSPLKRYIYNKLFYIFMNLYLYFLEPRNMNDVKIRYSLLFKRLKSRFGSWKTDK